jgi:hypothetical protein
MMIWKKQKGPHKAGFPDFPSLSQRKHSMPPFNGKDEG